MAPANGGEMIGSMTSVCRTPLNGTFVRVMTNAAM